MASSPLAGEGWGEGEAFMSKRPLDYARPPASRRTDLAFLCAIGAAFGVALLVFLFWWFLFR
jgi:hypothetical protein